MHPPRFKHACFLHLLVVGLALGGALGLQGCTSSGRPDTAFAPEDTLSSTVDRDSALAVLTSMRRTAFDSAFAALDDYAVTRYVRTEQLDPAGVATGVRSAVVRYPKGPDRGSIRRLDSIGTFRDGGLFGRAAPDRGRGGRPADLAAQILPSQPAFVEPRTREAFEYGLQSDSVSGVTPVYVLEVVARTSGTGRDQGVRHARLLIDRASKQLIGLALVRAEQVLLFGEQSQMSLRLQRAPDGTWVPHIARIRTFVRVPFRAPRQFRTVSAFYDYTL